MALRAKKPDQIQKRLKMLLFGAPGVGKTRCALKFPRSYVFDCERGCDHYTKLISDSNSVVMQSADCEEIIKEVRALGTEKHDYRTVILDPTTTLEADLVERAERQFGQGDMRIWSHRDKYMRRLFNLLLSLDMNVIVTCHGKIEYGEGMAKIGTTHDGWKRLPYMFDLVVELEKRGDRVVGNIRKSRIETFLGDQKPFDFSYEAICARYPIEILERTATPSPVASAEQVAEIKRLLDVIKLPDGETDKWLKAANVEDFEDMPADKLGKCITNLQSKLTGGK